MGTGSLILPRWLLGELREGGALSEGMAGTEFRSQVRGREIEWKIDGSKIDGQLWADKARKMKQGVKLRHPPTSPRYYVDRTPLYVRRAS